MKRVLVVVALLLIGVASMSAQTANPPVNTWVWNQITQMVCMSQWLSDFCLELINTLGWYSCYGTCTTLEPQAPINDFRTKQKPIAGNAAPRQPIGGRR